LHLSDIYLVFFSLIKKKTMAEAFENAFDDLFREGEGLADAGDWIRENDGDLNQWVQEINNSCERGDCTFPGSSKSATNFKNTYIKEDGTLKQEWMKNTKITKGADDEALYQFSGKYKYTDASGETVTRKAPPLKARQIREIFRGVIRYLTELIKQQVYLNTNVLVARFLKPLTELVRRL